MSDQPPTRTEAQTPLAEVSAERQAQDAKWGEQNHSDLSPDFIDSVVRHEYRFRANNWKAENARLVALNKIGWDGILLEEVYEALAEDDATKLRAELIQVAAVAVAWVEAIDRRAGVSR